MNLSKGVCETCGAKLVEYKHGLSKGLCRSLIQVAVAFKDTKAHEIKDMGLDYNHRCNFQKLRYWRLVEKVGEQTGKGGLWRITETGKEFIQGKISLPKFVWTYRGKVERYDGEHITIFDVSDGWKSRSEYAKESKVREGELR